MRTLLALFLLVLCSACGGGNAVAPGPGPAEADWFVNAQKGDDANPGTLEAPWKTLTAALSKVSAGDVIGAFGGFYDSGSGESFPLDVPAGVSIVRVEDPNVEQDMSPQIKGAGPTALSGLSSVTMILRAGARLEGLLVHCPKLPKAAGILLAEEDAELHRTFVQGPVAALVASGVRRARLIDTQLAGGSVGLQFSNSGHETVVQACGIYSNSVGVQILDLLEGAPDFGGGLHGSTGGNRIYSNESVGMWVSNVVDTVYAQGNYWDGNTLSHETMAPPPMATDILTLGVAAVDAANPQLWPDKGGE